MLNTVIHQQPDLFDNVARQWHEITGTKLLFISLNGELLGNTNGATQNPNWQQILEQVPPHESAFLSPSNKNVIVSPLVQNGQPFGYLASVNAERQYVPLLGWMAETVVAHLLDAQAIQDMTDELISAWDQLELIYKVTESLALTTDLPEVLQSVLQEIQKVTHTTDGFIQLRKSDSFMCVTGQSANDKVFCDSALFTNLTNANHVILCNNAGTCRQAWPAAPENIETLLATQLPIIGEDVEAAIGLLNKANKNFTAGDAKLLVALAQHIATIIKNYIIHEKLIVEERLTRELEIAAEIQESLLPTKLPQVGGLSMAVSSLPASEVGGDFYDFITVDDRHLTLVVGDVSGKGIPAAMLTSVTRTMLRVEAMRGEPPHRIIQLANSVLYPDLSRADAFVTVFVATIDTFEGKLTYASAGHTPALLRRTGSRQVEQLRATMLPIGIFDNQDNQSSTVNLQAGDTLVFYTDGITEAQSPNNDLFGLNRLIYIVESRGGESPEHLQQYIQSEVVKFRRDASGRDDATLLILKTLPQSETTAPQDISTIIKTVDFLYPANIDYLSQISQQITDTCKELSALPSGPSGEDFIYLIELAISEICTNIVKHAYVDKAGNITGQVTLLNNGVQLDFFDQGEGFDPNTVPEPVSDPNNLVEGGYGLHIVRKIMDVVSYESHPDKGNHWHLIKFLPPSQK